jgi:catechol 2,3-dioxygenase
VGFDLRGQLPIGAAFLADGDPHHHIALNTFESAGGSPAPPGSTGLFHFAIRFDDQDGNGIELCLDRPPADWPRTPDGQLVALNDELELDGLLARS